jgi:hypothetical protein
LREKLREKNETASQAGSDDQAKRYARKTSAFAFLLDGDKAAKTLQCSREKFCERNTSLLNRLNEPHKPISGNAEKSFKRENYHVF